MSGYGVSHFNAVPDFLSYLSLLPWRVAVPGQGIVRPLYFTILISHVILAIVIVPLILITLYRAARGDFIRHKRIARWTLPLWLYVSVTGVIVYLMLYHIYPSPPTM